MPTHGTQSVVTKSSEQNNMAQSLRSDALPPPPADVVAKALNAKSVQISWLAGDGSDRCYYRIADDKQRSYVLMQLSETDAKALRENGYDWVEIGKILIAHNIYIPQLIATLPDFAALIIEDYGDIMFETRVMQLHQAKKSAEILDLYRSVFPILGQFLSIKAAPKAPWCVRSFDQERFIWEMNFFVKNYLEPVAQIHFTPGENEQFQKEIQSLAKFLATDSQWFVHRDFHSRNVMWRNHQLAVIDFQDARLGPAAYDLVSLCFDSYVPLTPEQRQILLTEGIETLSRQLGAAAKKSLEQYWRPMLLQRQIKAIGSFGYLSIKKNRGNYLKYVGPALDTIIPVTGDTRWPFVSKDLLQRMREKTPSL